MYTSTMRKLIILVVVLIALLALLTAVQQFFPALKNLSNTSNTPLYTDSKNQPTVLSEESIYINVVKNASPSVVTVAVTSPQISQNQIDPNDPFSFFFGERPQPQEETLPAEPQNIGSGFIVSGDGIIVTNKHVVSETGAKYTIITNANKRYTVDKIYRDPLNDMAILKINPNQNGEKLKPLELGNSDTLQVGQIVVAIGTPLGEFSNSATHGIISGLGRGITAGSRLQGFVEQLDNVIQTDAAISPGNSGGPLLNSSGQAIGVNTAVSQSGQNIGFAIPINAIKESLKNFQETGSFNRPYLGVAYRILTKEIAEQNDLAQGAYIQTVVAGSAAAKAGVQIGDVITKINGAQIEVKKGELSTYISKYKVGDTITLTIFRDGKTQDIKATLETAPEQ